MSKTAFMCLGLLRSFSHSQIVSADALITMLTAYAGMKNNVSLVSVIIPLQYKQT